jgi:hypothetical protein
MKHLLLFEELNYSFNKDNKFKYEFKDSKGSHYKVAFSGPFKDIGMKGAETGITYDMEFTADDMSYKSLTNSGEPFSVTNFIFDNILKDFINSNKVDTISIIPIDVDEDIPRHENKKFSRYHLYLRSINRVFNNTHWKVIKLEYEEDNELVRHILLINSKSEFWRKNNIGFKSEMGDKILELKVLSKSSNSGSTKEFDIILDEPFNNKSLSSNVLLRKRLSEEELSEEGMPPGLKQIILKAYKKNPKLAISINNLKFLKDTLEEKKILKCEYCNKGPLVIYDTFFVKNFDTDYIKYGSFRSKNGATCDHKNPISKGGSKFTYDNLAVCCSTCNTRKGNMSYEEWTHYLKTKELPPTIKKLPGEPISDYDRVLKNISRNKIFKVEKKEKDNYIQFSVFSDYNYLDIYKIIKLIVRGRGAVRRINDNLYLIDFKK